MFRLGLTGSIATGKSRALDAFGDLGAATFSADDAVHRLYAPGGAAVAPVGAAFPGTVRDGAVDRAALAEALVAAPERLAALEAIVHPLVRAEMARFADAAEAAGATLAVLDIPLLYETGFDHGLDAVAVTVCAEAELRRRALARPGMTVDKLEAILARQMPQGEKRRRADFVIETDGPVEATRARIAEIVAQIGAEIGERT